MRNSFKPSPVRSMIAAVCAAAVLAVGIPLAAQAASLTATTTDYLNLREGAGTDAAVLFTLGKGVTVTVLDNSNGQWAKVKTSGGHVGYCSKDYLRFAGNVSSPSGSGMTATTTDYLNLRTGAGFGYRVVVTLAAGTKAEVLDNSNADWVEVKTSDGKQGWCSREYLTLSGGQTPAAPQQPSTPSSPPSSGALTSATVTADVLRLREGPSTSTAVVGYALNGATLKPLGDVQNGWLKVQTSGGKTGYVSAEFLKLTYSDNSGSSGQTGNGSGSATGGSGQTSAISSATVTADVLRLREGPGTATAVVGYVLNGAVLKPLGNVQGGWLKVQTSGGKTGYVSTDFVRLDYSESSGSSGNGAGSSSGGGQTTSDITGAVVTADVLRLRESPNTSSAILDYLSNGTVLKALGDVQNGWLKVQTSGGKTGYVSTDFVSLLHNGESAPAPSGGSVKISASSGTIPQGKSMWISSSGADSWSSSNSAVATVTNGYVYAAAPGTAQITASSGSAKAVCPITVTEAEPVKAAFASPNIAGLGKTVTFTAVTDSSRDSVVFDVTQPDGSKKTITASSSKPETTDGVRSIVWTASASFQAPGTCSFTARSSKGGTFSQGGISSDVLISSQSSETATANESRRASDKMLSMIAGWEGYASQVYADQLASSHVPTIGYGDTLSANEVFYNHLSQTEAWALLADKVNNASYTTELNRMIRNRHYLMNQNQADSLISFAYNVGAGYFNSSSEMDFRRIMDNAVVPPDSLSSGLAAKVTYDTSLRADHSLSSSSLRSVSSGTSVTVTGKDFSNTRDGWYQVRLSDGTSGWINSGYVTLSNADSLRHDLNYTNAYAFGTELILWNQAGGKFYAGLFYRRIGEANIYNYGDYTVCRFGNLKQECSHYTYPPSAAWLFQ